jgi:putative Ca2+/H+ antiporter (TMEM165/GDT1 family)
MSTQDPLARYGRPLVAVLIAVLISLFIAALIGGSLPLEYTGRALAYLVLVLYVIVGAFVVFRLVAQGEQQALSPGRLLKWTASLWLWPLLAMRRRS